MSLRTMLLAVAATACLASPLAAQATAPTASPVLSAAPVLARQSVGVHRLNGAPSPARNPAPFRADTRQNRALMIVGGAAMLTGAVVGSDAGTLISVGGAVVFLWGLYQYLQ
ncbi:MAG: hypothetical protein ACYC3L_09545 [Gemmatimonadaceae bacterium]